MGRECAYSFRDLYQAAHGHPMSQVTEQDLYRITQEQRNQWVASGQNSRAGKPNPEPERMD